MRRILLIIGFLLVVIGVGSGIYFIFFYTPSEPSGGEKATGTPPGALPISGERTFLPGEESGLATGGLSRAQEVASGGITQIKSVILGDVAGVKATSDKSGLNYYDRSSGKFYRLDANGEPQELSSKAFFNVTNVSWSGKADKAILEYPDGSNIVYNFTNGSQTTLPRHWEKFDFSPSGNQITGLSIGIDPNNRWLFTSNADGTGAKLIEALGENADKVQVAWSPNNQVIAFSNTGLSKGFGREQILLIGQNKENFRGLIVEGLNFEGKWSPDSSRVLYSVASPEAQMRPTLWIVNAEGEAVGSNRKNLGLNTWIDKCTFADSLNLYCAVPQSLPEGAGLERGIASDITDRFFKINLTNGVKTLIAIPEIPINATNLSVSNDGATLFFQDNFRSGVNSIRLK